METSDSDYFESADEDFLSDVESHEKSSKSPEASKNRTSSKDYDTSCNFATLSLKGSTENTTTQQLNKREENLSEKTPENEKLLLLDNNSNQKFIHSSTNSPQVPSPSTSLPLKTILTNDNIQSPEQHNIPQKKTSTPEENLWDEDELDWGSEVAKEELNKSQTTPAFKDEDNAWDDFDTDWESSEPSVASVISAVDHLKQPADDRWETLEESSEHTTIKDATWNGWSVSSLFSTATQSVSSITNQVSQGLSTVLECSMGIPQPEELAKINSGTTEKPQQQDDNIPPSTFGLESLVKFVESTGSKVITGGLDTLEAIGKKTVEVLQEGDPGFKKKRAFLKLDKMGKPNLSQILREAKEMAEKESEPLKQENKRKFKNYETLFDDHQGLVHLEALEMLSKLCSIKLDNLHNSLTDDALRDMQETLEQVKELCELPEDEEDSNKISLKEAQDIISNFVSELNVPITFVKFFNICEDVEKINLSLVDDEQIHQQAINSLSELTAICMEQFHKAGELLMVKEHRSTADEADSLVQITTIAKAVILQEAEKFTERLSSISGDKDRINSKITNIFYEAGNSSAYIQDAFQLLIPVLQVGAV
ncbi:protein FAM114A2-like isoform X1 [Euwallacea similis]|uniref:protein FAM114A2-like isoform X1 n=1 Tax=Euwallacea similis TaxID=1736056 RepID=UPI00344C761F